MHNGQKLPRVGSSSKRISRDTRLKSSLYGLRGVGGACPCGQKLPRLSKFGSSSQMDQETLYLICKEGFEILLRAGWRSVICAFFVSFMFIIHSDF